MAAPSAAWLCPCLPPPPQGAEQEELGFSGVQVVGIWAGRAQGRQEVETRVEDSNQGSREVGTSTRMLGAGDTPPNPRKTEKRTVPEHCEGPRRARSHSRGPPFGSQTEPNLKAAGFLRVAAAVATAAEQQQVLGAATGARQRLLG